MADTSFLIPVTGKIKNTLLGSIADRTKAEEFLAKLDNVDIDDRADSFGAFPRYGVITGSWWALETLWCCAYAVATFGPQLETAIQKKQSPVYLQQSSTGLVAIGALNWAFGVIKTKSRMAWLHSNVSWPYLPDGSACYDGEDLRRAENSFLGAAGWILLHELAHIHHGHSGSEGRIDEEAEADNTATRWLFENAPFGTATERAEGLVTALFYMTVRELICGADGDHPKMANRIRDSLKAADLHRNAWPLCVMATLIDMLLQWTGNRNSQDRQTEQPTCQSYLDEVLNALGAVRPEHQS